MGSSREEGEGFGCLEGFLNDHSTVMVKNPYLYCQRGERVERRVGMRLQRRVRMGNQGRITPALYTVPSPESHDCLLVFTYVYLVLYISVSENP